MLSVQESATMLGVSTARVRKLIADGALPADKVGKSWVLEEKDVMNRLASKPRGGRPAVNQPVQLSRETAANETGRQSQSQELKRLYAECKEAFRLRPGIDCIQSADSAEEAAFYIAVADFFLKQEQAKLVKAGAY